MGMLLVHHLLIIIIERGMMHPGPKGVQKKWASEKGEDNTTDGSLSFINEWMCEYKDRASFLSFYLAKYLSLMCVRCCDSPDFHVLWREGVVQDSMVRSTADSVFELRIDTRRHLRNFSSRIRYPSDAYHIWRIRISKHACQFWKLTVESRLCFCDYVIERIVTRILLFVASPTTYDNVIS